MIKKFFIIKILLLLPLIISATEVKNYTMGVENLNYYPIYQTVDNEYLGYARELFDTFAATLNIRFDYKPLAVGRLYIYFLKENSLDFKFPDNPKWQKSLKTQKIIYSYPVLKYIDGVITKIENKDYGIDKLHKLAIIPSFDPVDYEELIKTDRIHTIRVNNLTEMFNAVLNNTVDGAYVNIAIAKIYLERINKNNLLVFNKNLPYQEDFYYLSTLNNPEIIERFNKFILTNADTIQVLQKKYQLAEYQAKVIND